MNIPENGRVVVIDDKTEEGLPLVQVLSKNSVPVVYFTGLRKDELPTKPISGVRIIFLDIVLGTDMADDKTKISTAVGVINRILGKKNSGPYILIAWTKHRELKSKINEALVNNAPLFLLDLRKNECKYRKGGYNLNKIESRLREELNKAGAFHLFVLWENIVHKSTGKIVNDFSSFYPVDGNWNKNMFRVLRVLAEAYAGERLQPGNINEISKNSLLTFNMAFLDNLENGIENFQYAGKIIGLRPRGRPDADIISKINSRLLMAEAGDDNSIKPGNLYEGRINKRRHTAIQDVYNGELSQFSQRNALVAAVKNVFLEVSPVCDYTCNKLRAYRFLPGLMWPSDFSRQIKKGTEYLYVSPLVNIKDEKYRLVFDIRCLTTLPVNTPRSNKKLLGRIRHELLVDIQSYIARHVSRPGITSVNSDDR
jgi:hypothetical protein